MKSCIIYSYLLILIDCCNGQSAINSQSTMSVLEESTTSTLSQNQTQTQDAILGTDNTTMIESPLKICKPGNNVGYMLIRSPNITSRASVGKQMNISWDWSISVLTPPTYINAYIQLMAPGVRTTWKQIVAEKQSVNPRWFLWTPDALVDGQYKLRLVPDGKETFNIPANIQPCFANGECIPSVSASFTLSNHRGDLANYPQSYPANSAAKTNQPEYLIRNKVSIILSVVITCFFFCTL